MLQASMEWHWYVNTQYNRLMLDMGPDMQLCTPFKPRQLNQIALDGANFSCNDAQFYEQVCQYLKSFAIWRDQEICQIALNATAAKFYLNPMLAKSWFFIQNTTGQAVTEAVITLQSKIQRGQFLIVDCEHESALCMCLENNYQLDENIALNQFEVIRVLLDRVMPLLLSAEQQKRA